MFKLKWFSGGKEVKAQQKPSLNGREQQVMLMTVHLYNSNPGKQHCLQPPLRPHQQPSQTHRIPEQSGACLLLQVNDPDAGLWMVVYLVPAALTLLVSINPSITDNGVWRSLCDLHSAGCVFGTIALAYSLFAYAQGNIFHEEEGRELFGLVIITIWMSLCRSSAKSPLGGVGLVAAVVVALFPFVSWLYIYVNKDMRESWPTHCKTVM
ncbi:PREDICTED: transmembrane protein 220 [Ficedula albicollis]|uniref:transmembrane protein 220 n=1 Tax=Ficedula albicollis TaxID=59894 RepID=UPI0007AD8538|nr:PREDICTED: transmembrane protein 220 [Ficedula albicollis]